MGQFLSRMKAARAYKRMPRLDLVGIDVVQTHDGSPENSPRETSPRGDSPRSPRSPRGLIPSPRSPRGKVKVKLSHNSYMTFAAFAYFFGTEGVALPADLLEIIWEYLLSYVVVTWGKNDSKQLGLGDHIADERVPQPVVIPGLEARYVWRAVSGYWHSLLLTDDGVYSYGSGGRGQLGHGTLLDMTVPTKIHDLDGKVAIAAGAGCAHTMVLCRDGLYSFGLNEYGQLGLNDTVNRSHPTLIHAYPLPAEPKSVTCGSYHTILLCKNAVTACGMNYCYQLGIGTTANKMKFTTITTLDGLTPLYASASYFHSVVVCAEGIFTWGKGGQGQLGHGDLMDCHWPRKVDAIPHTSVRRCFGGAMHTAFACDDGLYISGCWFYEHEGNKSLKQLADGLPRTDRVAVHTVLSAPSIQALPYRIKGLDGRSIQYLSCGAQSTAVACDDGTLHTFGCNTDAQLGYSERDSTMPFRTPMPVVALSDVFISAVECGACQMVALCQPRLRRKQT